MISTDTNNVRPRGSWIKILLDKLRLTLRFRLRLPEIDDVRNPLIAHAAIGSPGRARLFKGARARKRILLVFGIVVLMMGANSAFAQTQTCAIVSGGAGSPGAGVNPTYLANQDGRANEGCTILITLNANGSITTTHPNPATSFDSGLDDNLIGVINNTAQTITGLQLSSATIPIFAFDNDGVCAGRPGYTFSALGPNPNCAIATDPHTYGPAGINFTVINANTGIVNFGNGGIKPNSNSFFSLEGGNLTKIVVIVVPGLAISKQVTVVGGSAALPGGQLDYLVHVTNPATSPATTVVITDDISSAGAGRLTFVNPPAPTMNGSPAGVTVAGTVLTANYSAINGPLQPGQAIDVRFRVQIAAGIPAGTILTNTALVTWNSPTRTSSASVSIAIGETSAPSLVLTKTGPATMSLGQLGQFGLNVQNTGVSDAWNATLLDRLPQSTPTGGMCSSTPQILSAQVFQANGITPVPGKGPLVPGTDFSINYNGAPTCELTLTILTAAATISQNQRLIINYRTQLDANSQNGAQLTNIAGAIQWFDGAPSISTRQSFTRTLTDGTPGILDFQDTHTVTVMISTLAITKQVSVVGGGAAMPGGQLDYLVHVTNASTNPATSVVITDDLSSAGAGRLTFVNPAATMNGATAGVTVVGSVLTAGYSTLNGPLQPGQSIDVRFRVQIASGLPAGTTLTNTGVVTWNTPQQSASASVSINIGETSAPNLVLTKTGPATMSPGQLGQFGLNVQNTGVSDAWNATILDRLPSSPSGGMCSTAPQVVSAQVFQADGVTAVAGKGPLVAGTDFSISYNKPTCALTLTMLTAAATISQNQRLIINYRTQLDANSQNGAQLTNVAGAVQWFDGDSSIPTRQGFTRTLTDGTPGVLDFQDAHTVTVVVSKLTITKQVSVVGGGAAMPGGQLDYLVHVTNASTSPATSVVITDDLSSAGAGRLTFVNPAATMNGATAGVTVVGSVLTADYSTLNGPLQPGQSIDVRFRAQIAAGLPVGTTLTNTGVVTWNTPQQSASASVSIDIGETSAPNLVLTKTGPATMSVGQLGQFGLNVQNSGVSDAWNTTILDRLPNSPSGGMCSTTPQVVSAQVFQADGVTAVAGKGPLVAGTDFSISYNKPSCELTLTMLTAAATISQNQRLIINYRTQLDANSRNGAQLTNIAGAVQWFDGDSSIPTRQGFTRTLTDGTPGVLDFQDAHTVTVVISQLTITKQVSVVGGGAAMPGGQLDYLVHVTNVSTSPATSVVITDDLSSAGAGRLTFVNPAATMNGATAGVTVVGSVLTADYSTLNGPLQPGQSIDVRFRAQIAAGLPVGTTLTNTGVVTWNTPQQSASASVSIDIGETSAPNLVLTKTGPATMSVGQLGQFGLNVQNSGVSDAWNTTILDRLPNSPSGGMCSTTPQVVSAQVFQADGVTAVAGKGPLVAGTDFSISYNKPSCELTLTMLTAAATISQNQRLIINYRTQLDANSRNGAQLTNIAGAIQWFDAGSSASTRQA